MESQNSQRTQVLVVGGSLVGLSAALFLRRQGVEVIVIERHASSSPHPRAIGFTELSLEHYRAAGIEDRIPQLDADVRLRRVRVDSLAGDWQEEQPWTPGSPVEEGESPSPCRGAAIAQDLLEPILRAASRELGADIRMGAELTGFEDRGHSVTAHVRDRTTGREYEINADYLVAADGANGRVRTALGIDRRGVGHIRTIRSVLFRCEEAEHYLASGIQQFQIDQPGFSAFLTHYPDGRWVLMFSDDVERDQHALSAAVRRALGREMAFEILTTGRWEMAGRIADSYSKGRVFLAGDAAHQLPPTRGGFGANTGIDDVYNLAWKLRMVLRGFASPGLLATYGEERQPIGWLRHQQTFARPDYRRWVGDALAGEPLFGEVEMELGQRILSAAVPGGGQGLPAADRPSIWAGQPGTRVPHAWVHLAGRRVSTIDLFTRDLVLISSDDHWLASARALSETLGVPIETLRVGSDVVFQSDVPFSQVFGVGESGASLVRPDAVVAWRAMDESEGALAAFPGVVARLLGRSQGEPPAHQEGS